MTPGSASSCPLAPPQTRASAINAHGSSNYCFAARFAYMECTTLAGGSGHL
jgi:hypothetical protein